MFSDHWGNPLEYEPASVPLRGVAYLLDRFFLFLFWMLMVLLVYIIHKLNLPWDVAVTPLKKILMTASTYTALSKAGEVLATIFIVIMVIIAYLIIIMPIAVVEYFFKGQSFGKMITGMRIISSNAESPRFSQILIRAIFREFEGMMGIILIFFMATPRRQAFYDVLVGTVVIQNYPKEFSEDIETNYSGSKLFRLPKQYYREVLKWQRYYLLLQSNKAQTDGLKNYLLNQSLKKLVNNIPSMKSYLILNGGKNEGLENEKILAEFSRAFDEGGIEWVSR